MIENELEGMMEQKLFDELTVAVRQADAAHQETGGGTRHWLRDAFLPALEGVGLTISWTDAVSALEADRDAAHITQKAVLSDVLITIGLEIGKNPEGAYMKGLRFAYRAVNALRRTPPAPPPEAAPDSEGAPAAKAETGMSHEELMKDSDLTHAEKVEKAKKLYTRSDD